MMIFLGIQSPTSKTQLNQSFLKARSHIQREQFAYLFQLSYSFINLQSLPNQFKNPLIYIIKLSQNLMSTQHLPQGFVNPQGLKELRDYKYKSGKYTWLDNAVNPFWEWTVSLVPMWVAPNLITFVGWLFVIASYACMLIYDYTFEKDIPSYCFFFAAFCTFVYSTLDAIDGKQARRTKSSSPLGQLFDHGCDSFSITFFVLGFCQATKLQMTEVFIIFTASQATFWTSNWMEYNTGILQTNVGQFGVTEAEYLCCLFHILTGVFGQKFWQITISVFLPGGVALDYPWIAQLRIGGLVAYFFGVLMFAMVIYSIIKTMYETKRLKPLGQFFTLAIVLVIEFIWLNLDLYEQYNGIILVNFGIVQSLIICKIIISSVTRMQLQFFHPEVIPSIIGTILMIGLDLRHNIKGQILVFWALFAINLAMTFKFLYSTIRQITRFLNINCFSIKKVEDSKKQN